MAETKIEWCDYTFNPWEGCTKVSEGCANCYAEARANRFGTVKWGPQGTRRIASESYWRQPLKWDREAAKAGERRRVFCASLADIFEDRPELVAPRVRLFHLISETRNLDWLLLTKRPQNIRRFHGGSDVPRSWPENMPPNVWLGVSVENQAAADERIPILLHTPAAVRFLSVEPLLGPIDLEAYLWAVGASTAGPWRYPSGRVERGGGMGGQTVSGKPAHEIDWVIIGGESGSYARPCSLAWIRSLVKQCREADVPAFVKQMGSRPFIDMTGGSRYDDHTYFKLLDPKGGDIDEWPADLKIREFPNQRR